MANGLLNMPQGQQGQQGQQQGNLLGGVFQSPSNPRRNERNRLLGTALQISQSQNPAGALMATGAAQAGLGLGRALGFETEGDRTSRILQKVQQQTVDAGLDPQTNPEETFNFISEQFRKEGAPELAMQAQQQKMQYLQQLRESQPEVPSDIRSLSMRAQAADLEPGTEEYREFFRTGGKERSTTQRERERDYYLSQGYSERLATDLANNNIKATTDFAGRTRLINITGGPVPDTLPEGYTTSSVGEGAVVPTNEEGQAVDVETPSGGQMGRNGRQGQEDTPREPQGLVERPIRVGLVPYLQEGLSRTVGQFFPENFTFAETTQDRTQLRSARQQLISALSISGRPPVIEQERIENNLPGLGPIESPERARTQLTQLTGDLLRQRKADLRDLEDPGVNQTLKREIQKRINGVDAMLRLVDPRALQTGEPTEQPDFSFDQAQDVLGGAVESGTLPEGASLGAYDYDSKAYPIIIDGQQATNSEGTPLYILPDEDE